MNAIIPTNHPEPDCRHQPANAGVVVFPNGRCGYMSNDWQLSDIEIMDEIRRRNRLRKESGLPPVEPQQEIDRIRRVRERQDFEQWMKSPLRYRVQQKLLQRLRRRISNRDWQPIGILSGGGWAFHVALVRQMQKLRSRLGG
jgi:hypothetical protein